MIEHCIDCYNDMMTAKNYQIYMTDSIRFLVEQLAQVDIVRFADFLDNNEQEEPEKSGDDIAREVIQRAGLKVKHDTI